MRDIEKLLQNLKRRAISANEFGESLYVKANDVIALVEALESEKRICATWRKTSESSSEKLEKAQAKADVYDMLRDDYGLREKGVGLADFVDWQAKRIAELESRTVKLPKPHAHLIWIQAGHAPDDYWDDVAVSHSENDRCCDGSERYPVYAKWEIEEMLAGAGIQVIEGEG